MPRHRLFHAHHASHRAGLRGLGAVLTAVGGVFTAIGLISFFSSTNSFEGPRYFWCLFVGLPMLGVGFALLKFGYLGPIARYVASEAAPVATDSFNYVASATKQGLHDVASAIGTGLRDATAARTCAACGHGNASDAAFCNQCGASLQHAGVCPTCQHPNDPAARFCSGCGGALPSTG